MDAETERRASARTRHARRRRRPRLGTIIGATVFALLLVCTSMLQAQGTPSLALGDPSNYPRDPTTGIKGLQPDFWPDPAENTPGLGTVSINFFWAEWEPTNSAPPCDPTQIELDGHCFVVPAVVDQEVHDYSALGVPATGILYGTPTWARGARPCSPVAPGFDVFCVPDDPADYGRFVAVIAQRYDGAHGHGRVTDFVIQNEVNTNDWFDIGCGQGTPCDLSDWYATYAALFNAAYDRITAVQPQARVLISLTHHFAPSLDAPTALDPILSVQTLLAGVVPLLGARQWSVAIHPYPVHSFVPTLDARDLPYVTLGNIGVLEGWLRAHYPAAPRAWEVEITEVGLHNPGTTDAANENQSDLLCTAFRNVLGTPGVTSFIYHRLVDQSDEMGLALGLRRADGTPKPAWTTWHDANDPAHLSCGFEWRGRTQVRHGRQPLTGANWYSSRTLPGGYEPQPESWWFERAESPGKAMVYECSRAASTYLTRDVGCRGDTPMGPVGALATSPGVGLVALSSCTDGEAVLVTTGNCTTGQQELLGYVEDASGAVPPASPAATQSAQPASVIAASPTFTG